MSWYTLEALGITYMISGSPASIYYGEPRFTQDIDVVAEVTRAHVVSLQQSFPLPDFCLSEDSVREAIASRGQFDIIHAPSGLKLDVMTRRTPPAIASSWSSASVSRRSRNGMPISPERRT
jgi:hypothetical protein